MTPCAKCGTFDGVRFIEFGDGLAIPFCRRHVPLFVAMRELQEALTDLGRSMKAMAVAAAEATAKFLAARLPQKDDDA